MAATAALKLEDVVFRFLEKGSRNILDHVSLEVEAGRITVIMGSSGCGKSTLAAVAAGLYPENGGYLESGDIRLFGESVSGMDPQRRAGFLSLMFQNPDLQFCMASLRKELYFCMENVCLPPEEMPERAEAIARELQITQLLDQPLASLSGGEKQKVSLACLMAVGSRCLVLDEAFANIDEACAREIRDQLIRLNAGGTTILAIDHQLDLWKDVADEIIILGEGGRPLLRGINRQNLEQYRDVFLEQGLFYPGEPERRAPAAVEPEPAIVFQELTVPASVQKTRFGREIFGESLLDAVNVTIGRGTITAVLGPSGSGKTSTFLALLKQHPYRGTILVNGRDTRQIRPLELYREVGIVFQNPANQFITQKVEDEVAAGIRVWNRNIPEEECSERTAQLLEDYGLKRQRRYSPYMLSQGQQRRLAVLSVLAGGQKILLLDEPTYGQDYRSTRAMMEQLEQKVRQEGLTVVFITHDRKLARKWADRILILKDRKLLDWEGEGNDEA